MRTKTLALLVCFHALACSGSSGSPPAAAADASDASASDASGADASARATILDAFFGLDHALPATVNAFCPGGAGLDGMPITFSRRVTTAPEPGAFVVTTASGATHTPKCAPLAPATEKLERFTVLLIGELGTDPGDPPVRVDVVGSVPLDDGEDARGLSTTNVTPLTAGPSLLLALAHTPADLAGSAGSVCPPSTNQIVLTVWEGGVTDANGAGLGASAAAKFHVTVDDGSGATREVTPLGLGGTGDHDNFVQVCLGTAARPVSVRVEPGVAFDPRGDPNPSTAVDVTADN